MARNIDLTNVSADRVMKALSRLESMPRAVPSRVKEALTAGETGTSGGPVTVLLPKCQILDNQESGFFTDMGAEVYVVGLAMDLTGEGATFEQAPEIFHNVSRTASAPLIVSSTPLFNNIYDHDHLPLLGNGIVLYGPRDPKGLLDVHMAVLENDGGYRELGQLIEKAARQVDLPAVLDGALSAASLAKPEIFLLRNTFQLLFHTLITLLKNNHDDVIQDLHFSALKHQRYLPGIHPFQYRGAKGYLKIDVEAP
ncbi:MAG: hypothetical protein ACYTFG_19045 [Planctomycetota bacterium]|jgi:hypothetical protein